MQGIQRPVAAKKGTRPLLSSISPVPKVPLFSYMTPRYIQPMMN